LVAKTPDQARASAAPMPMNAPAPTGTSPTGDFTDFLKIIAKSPSLITGYSKLLKAAKFYKGPITDKYTPALQKAFFYAEKERASVNLISPIGRDEFLQQTIALGGIDPGTGAGGGPSKVTSVTKYTSESAKELINSIIQDTLGRKATAAEIKRYTSTLKGIEGKASTVTRYSGSGSNQTQTVSPGINEKQYLVDQIAGTDEGKANKVLGYYETFMNALGGR